MSLAKRLGEIVVVVAVVVAVGLAAAACSSDHVVSPQIRLGDCDTGEMQLAAQRGRISAPTRASFDFDENCCEEDGGPAQLSPSLNRSPGGTTAAPSRPNYDFDYGCNERPSWLGCGFNPQDLQEVFACGDFICYQEDGYPEYFYHCVAETCDDLSYTDEVAVRWQEGDDEVSVTGSFYAYGDGPCDDWVPEDDGSGAGGGGGGGTGVTTPPPCIPANQTDTRCLRPMTSRDLAVLDSSVALYVRDPSTITDPNLRQRCEQLLQWWAAARAFPNDNAGAMSAEAGVPYPNTVIYRGATDVEPQDKHDALTGPGASIHFDPSLLDNAIRDLDNNFRRNARRALAAQALHEGAHLIGGLPLAHLPKVGGLYVDPYFENTNLGTANSCIVN